MLNLLLNPRAIIPAATLLVALSATIYGWHWKGQYNKSQASVAQLKQEVLVCKVNYDLLEAAVNRYKEAGKSLERKLSIKEKEANKAAEESEQQIKMLLKAEAPTDCNAAIKWGMQRILA